MSSIFKTDPPFRRALAIDELTLEEAEELLALLEESTPGEITIDLPLKDEDSTKS